MPAEVIRATESTELTGKVVYGVIIIENGGILPDETIVRVEPLADLKPAESVNQVSQLREMLLSHAGVIDGPELPTDLAENPDHYLYGTPKRP
jgi:hypothetical protein